LLLLSEDGRVTFDEGGKPWLKRLQTRPGRLKQLVAELSLQVHMLKKTAVPELE